MGNQQSRLYHKLWECLPNPDNPGSWFSKDSKPFLNREDKDQFIHATMTVLSQNGAIALWDHDIRLLYSRRSNDRMVARVVAEFQGVVKAQVAAREDGKDQNEAFKALRRHVERSLDGILKDVPGASYSAESSLGKEDQRVGEGVGGRRPMEGIEGPPVSPRRESGGTRAEGSAHGGMPIEAPPAYGKAVRDWRSNGDEKK